MPLLESQPATKPDTPTGDRCCKLLFSLQSTCCRLGCYKSRCFRWGLQRSSQLAPWSVSFQWRQELLISILVCFQRADTFCGVGCNLQICRLLSVGQLPGWQCTEGPQCSAIGYKAHRTLVCRCRESCGVSRRCWRLLFRMLGRVQFEHVLLHHSIAWILWSPCRAWHIYRPSIIVLAW